MTSFRKKKSGLIDSIRIKMYVLFVHGNSAKRTISFYTKNKKLSTVAELILGEINYATDDRKI